METDPQLRRVVRDALLIWGVVLVLALVSGGGVPAVAGVLVGGLLVAVSYRGIRRGVDAAMASSSGVTPAKAAVAWRVVVFVGRFAMLGLVSYVMIVRLRAHAEWTLAGATSMVAAVGFEAIRQLRPRNRTNRDF